jgi:hypothetical protein
MGDERNAYTIFVETPKEGRPFGRPIHDSTKIEVNNIPDRPAVVTLMVRVYFSF